MQVQVNDDLYELSPDELFQVMGKAVPVFLRTSQSPATLTEDMIRGFVKLGWEKFHKNFLKQVYGQYAPTPGKREDKLPYLWPCVFTFIINQLLQQKVLVLADEPDQQGVRRIVGLTTIPVQSSATGEDGRQATGDCGCPE